MEENTSLAILQLEYFQQDGAPAHYSLMVRYYLNNTNAGSVQVVPNQAFGASVTKLNVSECQMALKRK